MPKRRDIEKINTDNLKFNIFKMYNCLSVEKWAKAKRTWFNTGLKKNNNFKEGLLGMYEQRFYELMYTQQESNRELDVKESNLIYHAFVMLEPSLRSQYKTPDSLYVDDFKSEILAHLNGEPSPTAEKHTEKLNAIVPKSLRGRITAASV